MTPLDRMFANLAFNMRVSSLQIDTLKRYYRYTCSLYLGEWIQDTVRITMMTNLINDCQ